MICANLHAFLASSLSTAEADAFRAHLTDCTACQREASTMLQLDALVSGANDASPRELLRQFACDVLAHSRKYPGEPEKVIADVLGTSPEAERLATSEAARLAAEERARVLGEALREWIAALDAAKAADRERARVDNRTFAGMKAPPKRPGKNAVFIHELPPEEQKRISDECARTMAPVIEAGRKASDAKARLERAVGAVRALLASLPAAPAEEPKSVRVYAATAPDDLRCALCGKTAGNHFIKPHPDGSSLFCDRRPVPAEVTPTVEVRGVVTSTGRVIDRKGENVGDVWCAVTVEGMRRGAAAWLPIDEPMGAEVAVTVAARKG